MRRLVPALLLLAACAGNPPATTASWSRVDPVAFTAELAAAPDTARPRVIVDVREPELFSAGHIPGAINLPWPDAKTRAPQELPKDADIVLVCHGGPMGDELAQILVDAGYPAVRNLAGGMRDWTGPVAAGS